MARTAQGLWAVHAPSALGAGTSLAGSSASQFAESGERRWPVASILGSGWPPVAWPASAAFAERDPARVGSGRKDRDVTPGTVGPAQLELGCSSVDTLLALRGVAVLPVSPEKEAGFPGREHHPFGSS